jgi:hypothetical protein
VWYSAEKLPNVAGDINGRENLEFFGLGSTKASVPIRKPGFRGHAKKGIRAARGMNKNSMQIFPAFRVCMASVVVAELS